MAIFLHAREALPGAATATVLVVDDEPDIRHAIEDLLRDSLPGVRVLTAASGQGGLDVLGSEHVDLIVTDYKMPGMNGLEFLEQAGKVAPRVPRILVTAFSREVARLGGRVKVDAFFNKPLEPGALLRSVATMLGLPDT